MVEVVEAVVLLRAAQLVLEGEVPVEVLVQEIRVYMEQVEVAAAGGQGVGVLADLVLLLSDT
jgi:hypothetical protein